MDTYRVTGSEWTNDQLSGTRTKVVLTRVLKTGQDGSRPYPITITIEGSFNPETYPANAEFQISLLRTFPGQD